MKPDLSTAAMMNGTPLISVGLPTYNRASDLKRCIDSVLAQDYSNFELIISDNASTDGTQSLCEELGRKDQRIRYIRQTTNRGPAANFQAVLDEARGEFFMWLGDDDWLAPNYISRCIQVLLEEPEYVIVCGLPKHCNDDGTVAYDGDRINLPQASGKERVLEYLRQIHYDGTFYAVMRRDKLLREPIKNTLAGDWLFISPIVFTGKVKTLDDTYLYRSDGGASAGMESLVRSLGMPLLFAKSVNLFYLKIAISVFYQILVGSPSFKAIGLLERLSLGYSAFRVIRERFMPLQFPLITSARTALNRLRSRVIIRTRLKRTMKSAKGKMNLLRKP
jgi:glycosyltransferase involved in cell wall biosynthesis